MATDAQEGPSDAPQGVSADDALLAGLLPILKATPLMPFAGLPGAQEWANKFFKSEISWDPQASFLEQIVTRVNSGDVDGDATPWDPYDEGYDDGPGDLMDCWHTDERTANGQYRGTTVDCENVFDELGALVICVASWWAGDLDDLASEFTSAAEVDWVPPASQAERDAVVVERIRIMWGGLSTLARVSLLAELGGMQR